MYVCIKHLKENYVNSENFTCVRMYQISFDLFLPRMYESSPFPSHRKILMVLLRSVLLKAPLRRGKYDLKYNRISFLAYQENHFAAGWPCQTLSTGRSSRPSFFAFSDKSWSARAKSPQICLWRTDRPLRRTNNR